MPFDPINPKKGPGRPKGSINKNKTLLAEIITKALGKTLPESILDDLKEIEKPVDRANVKLGLMKYVYPAQRAITVEKDAEVEDTGLRELYEQLRRVEQ